MSSFPDELAVTLSETASDAMERPIAELPQLSGVIDVDALEALVEPPSAPHSADVTVTFSFSGLTVFISSGSAVYVHPVRGDGLCTPSSTVPGDR